MASILLLFIIFISYIQMDQCQSQTHQINCSGQDACKKQVIQCPPYQKCEMTCAGKAACSETIVVASSATDFHLSCISEDACNKATVACGTGQCSLMCGSNVGSIVCREIEVLTHRATSFQCTNQCPLNIQQKVFTLPPTPLPTNHPPIPSHAPSKYPTNNPSFNPSHSPSHNPTDSPSAEPTIIPTDFPTENPTIYPSYIPTTIPTNIPTNTPTTSIPSKYPTNIPSDNPTISPSHTPTIPPSKYPTTPQPTPNPTPQPTIRPTTPPTTPQPTFIPTNTPTHAPSKQPSNNPTISPTLNPTFNPSTEPTLEPTYIPTHNSTDILSSPTIEPTFKPSNRPTHKPSISDYTNTATATPTRKFMLNTNNTIFTIVNNRENETILQKLGRIHILWYVSTAALVMLCCSLCFLVGFCVSVQKEIKSISVSDDDLDLRHANSIELRHIINSATMENTTDNENDYEESITKNSNAASMNTENGKHNKQFLEYEEYLSSNDESREGENTIKLKLKKHKKHISDMDDIDELAEYSNLNEENSEEKQTFEDQSAYITKMPSLINVDSNSSHSLINMPEPIPKNDNFNNNDKLTMDIIDDIMNENDQQIMNHENEQQIIEHSNLPIQHGAVKLISSQATDTIDEFEATYEYRQLSQLRGQSISIWSDMDDMQLVQLGIGLNECHPLDDDKPLETQTLMPSIFNVPISLMESGQSDDENDKSNSPSSAT